MNKRNLQIEEITFRKYAFFIFILIVNSLSLFAQESRPNIVFFLADDVTYNVIGCYGGEDAQTPNIDKLATEGMRFTSAYCAISMCAPFRAELYTGLYPVRSGCAYNHAPVKFGTKSVAHYLKDAGYRVGIAGKKHTSPSSSFPWEDFENNLNGKEVRDFMTRDEAQPFCLFLCSHNAHAPWESGDASKFDQDKIYLAPIQHDNPKTREVMTRYLAEVEDLDREVGDMIESLDASGQRDNTIVMFSSEQGWPLGFAKWSNWNLGVHTGLIACWPGKIKAGDKSNALIQVADILPTLLEAAGQKVESYQLDGQSFYRHLLGQKQLLRKYVYGLHNNVPEGEPYPIRSIRDDKYHYIWNLTPKVSYHESHIMIENSRLVWWNALKEEEAKNDKDAIAILEKFHSRPAVELYKVDEDPYEMNNLAENPEYVKVRKRLDRELKRWMEEQKDPGAEMDNSGVLNALRKSVSEKELNQSIPNQD